MKYRVSEFIATGFYSGYLPKAPGTWGSWVAMMITGFYALFSSSAEPVFCLLAALISTVIGIPASQICAEEKGEKDPGYIVIDEFAGQFLAFTLVPLTGLNLFFGFLFFRIFDIVKPWPADGLQKLPGGYGIVLDDVIAGFYAMLATYGASELISLL